MVDLVVPVKWWISLHFEASILIYLQNEFRLEIIRIFGRLIQSFKYLMHSNELFFYKINFVNFFQNKFCFLIKINTLDFFLKKVK